MKLFQRCTSIGFLCLLTSLGLYAQATEGSVLGTVIDSTSAAVAGVTVTVTNLDTNFPRTALTNDSGEYLVSNLPIGNYSVAAEKSGFKKSVQLQIQMTVKARVRVDLQLEVGAVSQ